jgi:PAS domain S-box-containing protein
MALQASEERYRSLVMSSTQLIWSTDAIGNVIEPMPTWQRFTGQSDEEILGWGWIKALHPDDVERVRGSWLTALEAKSICSYEYRLRRHDGIYRSFSVRGVPVLNGDGSVREWVGVSEDITERKEAEAQVVAKSMLLETTLQNMAQGVTVYDRDFKLIAYNQRYIDCSASRRTSSPWDVLARRSSGICRTIASLEQIPTNMSRGE